MGRLAFAVVVLVGCGDDGVRHIIDAPRAQSDGPPADQQIDAAGNPVTLTINVGGVPQPGIHVYFQNADSTVVLATTTDQTGTASAVMDAGGYVTAVTPALIEVRPSDDLATFAGVKPGDHLLLTANFDSFDINVTLPSYANATQYAIGSSCGVPSYPLYETRIFQEAIAAPSGTVTLYHCTGQNDVLVVAETGDGSPLASFYLANQTFNSGDTVDWSAQTYTDAAQRGYTYTNVPNTIPVLNISDTAVSTHGSLYQAYTNNIDGDGTFTTSLAMPTFTGAYDIVQADASTNAVARQHMVDFGPYAPTYTTDVGARLLPDLLSGPTIDPAAHTVAWTEDTDGVAPDFERIELYTLRPGDTRTWDWVIAAPRTGTSVTLPTLPTDVYDYNFAASDDTSLEDLKLVKVTGGYDVARPFAMWTESPLGLIPANATGALTFEDGLASPTFTGKHAAKRPSKTHRLTHRRRL